MENMKELNMEELKDVSGGYLVEDPENNKVWLVRQDGTVIAPVPSTEKGIEFAKDFGTSPTILTMDTYKKRFGRDLVW